MIEILEDTIDSLILKWEPSFGSYWDRYSYGNSGWRIYASLLAGIAGKYDLAGTDVAVVIKTSVVALLPEFSIFGDWREIELNLEARTAYWKSDKSGTLFVPYHRESIDDASYFVGSSQITSRAYVIRNRDAFLRSVHTRADSVSALLPTANSVLVTIDPSAMSDEFQIDFSGSSSEKKRSRTFVDECIHQVTELIV